MLAVDPVSLVIVIPLIPAACVWFNRKHTYFRAIIHVYAGIYGNYRVITLFSL